MTRTPIEWATDSWNPIAAYDRASGKRGWFCEKVSPGCTHCYAEKINQRLGNGHLYRVGNRAKLRFELAPSLTDPLHWRKPRRVFVNSMTDLFFEEHTEDMIAATFGVMAIADQHDFLVLTKRQQQMRDVVSRLTLADCIAGLGIHGQAAGLDLPYDRINAHLKNHDHIWPLPNVWLGVSVENQEQADLRIPLLLETPAAVRFLSCEPLLGPIEFPLPCIGSRFWRDLHWGIVGGESGAGARPCNVQWARRIVEQYNAAGRPLFIKQLGALPGFTLEDEERRGNTMPSYHHYDEKAGLYIKAMDHPKGGDPKEWPTELRVRQYPKVEALA